MADVGTTKVAAAGGGIAAVRVAGMTREMAPPNAPQTQAATVAPHAQVTAAAGEVNATPIANHGPNGNLDRSEPPGQIGRPVQNGKAAWNRSLAKTTATAVGDVAAVIKAKPMVVLTVHDGNAGKIAPNETRALRRNPNPSRMPR